jgi:hypothetical protein
MKCDIKESVTSKFRGGPQEIIYDEELDAVIALPVSLKNISIAGYGYPPEEKE